MMLAPVLLAACIAVEGERILVSDLARALPAFSNAPGDEEIGISPSPGVRRRWDGANWNAMASRFGVELRPRNPAPALSEGSRPADGGAGPRSAEAGVDGREGHLGIVGVQPHAGAAGCTRIPVVRCGPRRILRWWCAGGCSILPTAAYPMWARIRITRPPREVERGAMVEVEVASGGAVLKFEARAESGGEMGRDGACAQSRYENVLFRRGWRDQERLQSMQTMTTRVLCSHSRRLGRARPLISQSSRPFAAGRLGCGSRTRGRAPPIAAFGFHLAIRTARSPIWRATCGPARWTTW